MKFSYKVNVTLRGENGQPIERQWFEQGNDSWKIHNNIMAVLDRCCVDYERIEVQLGS